MKVKENTVTQEHVDSRIVQSKVGTIDNFGKPMTMVSVKLINGFTMNETTTCVDPANYDEKIGAEICMKKIKDRIWHLEGYVLQQRLYENGVSV